MVARTVLIVPATVPDAAVTRLPDPEPTPCVVVRVTPAPVPVALAVPVIPEPRAAGDSAILRAES